MRILAVLSHPITKSDVQAQLSAQPCVLDCAATQAEALHLLRCYDYSVVLVCCSDADIGIAGFVRNVRLTGSRLALLGIGRAIAPRKRAALLDEGIDDIVPLPCDAWEFASRLRAVLRRATGFDRSVLSLADITVDMAAHSVQQDGQNLRLSPLEYRALECLLLRKNTVVSKTTLLDALHDGTNEPDAKSIDVLIHRLRRRLEHTEAGRMIQTVRGFGFMVRETPAQTDRVPAAAAAEVAFLPRARAGMPELRAA